MWRALLLCGVIGGASGLTACSDQQEAAAEIVAPPKDPFEEAVQLCSLGLVSMEKAADDPAEWQIALDYFQQIAELLPDNALPPINLAICHFRLGKNEDALARLSEAEAIDPQGASLLYTLAAILIAEPWSRDREAKLMKLLDRFRDAHPEDARPAYLQATFYHGLERFEEAILPLQEALYLDPGNLALMLMLLEAGAEVGDRKALADAYERLPDRLGGFPDAAVGLAEQFERFLTEGEDEALHVAAIHLRNVLRPHELYGIGKRALAGPSPGVGALFPQQEFIPALPTSAQGGADIEVNFVVEEVRPGGDSALDEMIPAAGIERDRIWFRRGAELLLWDPQNPKASIAAELGLRSPPVACELLDVDQDGLADWAVLDQQGAVFCFAGRSADSFGEGKQVCKPTGAAAATGLVAVDVDHEGDLDFLLLRDEAAPLYLQNNLSDAWEAAGESLGLAGLPVLVAAASADFDDDGDLDLLVCPKHEAPRLFSNDRSVLRDESRRFGLEGLTPYAGLEVLDYDRDGLSDVLFFGEQGATLLHNEAGRALKSVRNVEILGESVRIPVSAACAADFDNDGDADVVLSVGRADFRTLQFYRNIDGQLENQALGLPTIGARDLQVGDYDADGDLDLLALSMSGEVHWCRNEGGNKNHWLRLQLKGKNDSNSKNNTEGRFARVEVRSGGRYQFLLGNGRTNHFGLAEKRQADVLRVVWTNGVPQTWVQVSGDRTLVEEQVLKGSCPFLYTWNGERYEFVTDLMWSSPLGMVLDNGTAAPHQSARDFVRIPGQALQPANGVLPLQITSELWETSYVDEVKLWAVDRPEHLQMWVDEAFRFPPYATEPGLTFVDYSQAAQRAYDHQGQDWTVSLRRADNRYATGFDTTRYQGLTRPHELYLEFEHLPASKDRVLLLWGWIFPTDSSINKALSQNPGLRQQLPSLAIKKEDGTWETLVEVIGLPKGKDKCLAIPLDIRQQGGSLHLRLSTNLEIYWNHASLATAPPHPDYVATVLKPQFAHLHARGFSRSYRRAPDGPHWFDYDEVYLGESWRATAGTYTRHGDVLPLLLAADDCYVVASPGDEISVWFDASDLPELKEGWRRDYVLYTDGWVKDADLNTIASATVEPLPYHGMVSYPDQPEHRFPDTEIHRRFLAEYQTRVLDGSRFRRAMYDDPLIRVPLSSTYPRWNTGRTSE